jgi:hypothetical protein
MGQMQTHAPQTNVMNSRRFIALRGPASARIRCAIERHRSECALRVTRMICASPIQYLEKSMLASAAITLQSVAIDGPMMFVCRILSRGSSAQLVANGELTCGRISTGKSQEA